MTTNAPGTFFIGGSAYVPTDPARAQQWHLDNINIASVWADYSGAGVTVAFIDNGFDLEHEDLAGQFNTYADYDYRFGDDDPQAEPGDSHGTAVAGVLGVANNDAGGAGVAFGATLLGLRVGFGAQGTLQMFEDAIEHAKDNARVINNSWGYSTPFVDSHAQAEFAGTIDAIAHAAALGVSVVFSAGNYAAQNDNTNYHNFQNSPYAITVAAYDENETVLSYSSPGATILVAAPGHGIVTTDVSGAGGYGSGGYVTAEGTSFAAPVVSGVIALMLEANPDLGYRDVQQILSYSARQIGEDASYQVNGAGLHFSHRYGFGAVDAHAAVRLAETWDRHQTLANRAELQGISAAAPVSIPDGSGHAAQTITIAQDLVVEHAQVRFTIDHSNASQLEVTLISPDGTRSLLADNAPHNGAFPEFDFYSVAFMGEHAAGTWTLEIADTVSGTTGMLEDWSLWLYGSEPTNDNIFIYTDEFLNLINPLDTNGGIDTINAAARTNNMSATLQAGIENIYTGDGNDYVTGNAGDNVIKTGRGNDVITASAGNDNIDGGAGLDTFVVHEIFAHQVTVHGENDLTLLKDGQSVRLTNIENFNFAGFHYTAADLARLSQTAPIEVIYAIEGTDGIAIRSSSENGFKAYQAHELNVGGAGAVLLEEREFAHLTLTNNAGQDIEKASMRMDDGLSLTLRGFTEVNLVADGSDATFIEIAGAQRGYIQTSAGSDTIDFLAFLIDQNAPAQDRTLTAVTQGGHDSVTIEDRTHYLAYDIDLDAGDDYFFAKGAIGGTVAGGAGADTFAFGPNNGHTLIEDFSVLENDRLDLSNLLEQYNPQDPIASFIALTTQGADTQVFVDGAHIATLRNVTLDDPVQNYIDNGIITID